VCVNFYDVHNNKGKFQAVKAAKEITVDGNDDNSIQTNSFNVSSGANCISTSLIYTGTITVHKTVDVGLEPLASFCFTLSPDPGNGQVCANDSGDAVFTNVPAGSYSATETASPATYSQVSNDCTAALLIIAAQGDSPACQVHDTIDGGQL